MKPTRGRPRGLPKWTVTVLLPKDPDYRGRMKTLAWMNRITMGAWLERAISREWDEAVKEGKA